MKILWMTTFEKGSFGHSELFGLSESLMKKGHEVTVIGASRDGTTSQGHMVYVKNPFRRSAIFKAKLAICLPWWILWKRPDFIIIEWQSVFVGIIPVFLSKLGLYKNNLIHDVRTIPVNTFNPRRATVFNTCVKISKKHFLGITTITHHLKEKICSEYEIPPQKVGVWSSGVDLGLFYPRDGSAKRKELGLDGKFIVFYHGSVGYGRGIVETVEAFSLLKERYEDIHFCILGSGIELEKVRRVKECKKLDNVHIHPPVAYREVPDYIAMSDICIVPLGDVESWRVSSPLKVMEYLGMGKPMIVTDILAHRDIITNESKAIFVSDVKPETLMIAIEDAYHRRADLVRMGEAGLRNAKETWSWDVQAENLVNYLENIRS